MAGGVRVTGLRECVRNLESMGTEVSDLKQAFGAISTKAQSLAAGFAPSRTGRLKASIKGSKTKNRASIRTNLIYAAPINYGWRRMNIEPQRFMQRADAAIQPEVVQMIEHELAALMRDRGF